jgi:hypothetical protein
MKSRWNVLGPELQIGLMLLAMSVSRVASAQSNDDTKTASDTTDSAAASQSSDSTEAAAAAKPEPAKPEPAKKAEPAKPEPAKPEPAKAEAAPAVPLSVEILPGSGYPEPRVRGIVGGSLWLTMHGLQFPYMAPETHKSEARVAISGSIWDDTSYARFAGVPSTAAQKRWENQARAVLRATPAYTTKDGWFVQGQIELVANNNQYVDQSKPAGLVDDLFVRAGKWNVFDVTVGRYQGWEVYHYGMGLDLNTFERRGAAHPSNVPPQPSIYGLDYYWDRPNRSAGNYAAHVYFTDYLRLELLGQIGTGDTGGNVRSIRPVAVLDLGYLKVKAGWEYGVIRPQAEGAKDRTDQNGFGGAIQFVINPYIEGGVNGAIGYKDSTLPISGLPDLAGSTTTMSYGGFLNGRVIGPFILGIGANQTHWESLETNGTPTSSNFNKQNYKTHFQSFFAVQYSFWDKLFLKFVGSHASYNFGGILQDPPIGYTSTEWGGRFRVMYLF